MVSYLLAFIFIFGLVTFCFKHHHLLLTLLRLEYLVLYVYLMMILFISNVFGDLYLILIFMTFSVCEGVLGLSVLITLIRRYGNDQVNCLSMVK